MIDLRSLVQAVRSTLAFRVNDGALRQSAVATWFGRMLNEYQSASVFEQLADQCTRAGFTAEYIGTLRRFAAEERAHGVYCGAVVAALGGKAYGLGQTEEQVPEHPDVDPREAATRNVLSIACLSETVAVALIGAERFEMNKGPLRDLLTAIWADEIGHANFGWRLAREGLAARGTAGEQLRTRLGNYLRVAFAALERHQLAHLPAEARVPHGGEALGLCDGSSSRELFYATVHEVIIPALEAFGLTARRAWQTRFELL